MLKLLAYFENQGFSCETFGVNSDNCPRWLAGWIKSNMQFRVLTGVLVDYNFLDVHPTGQSWSMHNCLHDWTLAALNQRVDQGYYWYSFGCVLETLDWNELNSGAYLISSPTVRHALRLLNSRFLDALDDSKKAHLDVLWHIAARIRRRDASSSGKAKQTSGAD